MGMILPGKGSMEPMGWGPFTDQEIVRDGRFNWEEAREIFKKFHGVDVQDALNRLANA